MKVISLDKEDVDLMRTDGKGHKNIQPTKTIENGQVKVKSIFLLSLF